jgi:hypothetical protein
LRHSSAVHFALNMSRNFTNTYFAVITLFWARYSLEEESHGVRDRWYILSMCF